MNSKELNNYIIEMYEKIANKCNDGENIENLNQYEKVFYITQILETEVNNGGFSEFFYNSSGNFAYDIVDAFNQINAKKTAKICKKALKIYKNKLPLNLVERRNLIDSLNSDKIDKKLEKCDDKFYNYDDNLNQLNYEFIMKYKDSFK